MCGHRKSGLIGFLVLCASIVSLAAVTAKKAQAADSNPTKGLWGESLRWAKIGVSAPNFEAFDSMGHSDAVEKFFVRMLQGKQENASDSDNAKDSPRTTSEKQIDALIQVLGHPQAGGERLDQTILAMKELITIGKPAVPKLIKARLSQNPVLAGYSAKVLEQIGPEASEGIKAVWPVLEETEKWKFMSVRAKSDYANVVDFAMRSLESKDAQVRLQAIYFVGDHKETKARAALLKMLDTAMPPWHRASIVESLVALANDEVVDAFILLLARDSWAAKGIGLRIFDERSPPGADERPFIIEALAKIGARKAAPKLLEVLQEKGAGRAYLGHAIIPLLGEWEYTKSIPDLRLILTSENDNLASLAARSLFQLKDRAAMPKLLLDLRSDQVDTRRLACKVLARHGTRLDIVTLGECLEDADEDVQVYACEGLERITGVKIREPGQNQRTSGVVPLWRKWIEANRDKLRETK